MMLAQGNKEYGVVFVGDSYATHTDWPSKAAEVAEINTYVTSALGGTGFVNAVQTNTNSRVNFEELLKEAANSLEPSVRNQYRYIVVEGGYNDHYYDQETIIQAIGSFTKTAKELFPNAQIIIGMNGDHADSSQIQNALFSVYEAYKKAAEKYHLYYLEGIEKVLNHQIEYFAEDYFHPNQVGGELIGTFTGEYLKSLNGTVETPYPIIEPTIEAQKQFPWGVVGLLALLGILLLYMKKKASDL